ncbi:TAXI family TRAP transporter solute-binding subunit [Pseudomonas zhanjiangensis]|uniref:TAXI family TRAP transporter solute-binding subunit n=1 Tax=Pseudomonas zhanjiangensis TaxID=3239015 RepID=A0ABV3YN02_9PSED
MNGRLLAWILLAALAGPALNDAAVAAPAQIRIGTGGQTGVYYVAGQAICSLLKRDRRQHGIDCEAPVTAGGVANVNGLRRAQLDFALMQADHQYQALNGLAPFAGEGALADLRSLFSLHSEVFTLLARRDARIAGLDDLPGKRVNLGNRGSGQRATFAEIMRLKGWSEATFALAADLKPAEQAVALADDRIDAMSYFVGHPNGAIQEATLLTDAVLVPVRGAVIDQLLAQKPYYGPAEIPAGLYRGNPDATPSFGVRAVLATRAGADPQVVYLLVKAVFEHFERFKRLHPAFAELREAEMISRGLSAPLHEGAARYYRERGWL